MDIVGRPRRRLADRRNFRLKLDGEEPDAWEALLEDRVSIDAEFVDAGLQPPKWERTDKGASIALAWPAPQPWDDGAEARQHAELQAAANQLVNSLRPRLERIGAGGPAL